MSVDDYVAGVLAGEAARGAARPRSRRSPSPSARSPWPTAAPSRRRLRPLRHDALPGAAHGDRRDHARGRGDRRRGADVPRRAGVGLLHRLVRRPDRAPVRCLAGRRQSAVSPSQDDDACQGAPAWTADLTADDLARALRAGGFKGRGCATWRWPIAIARAASRACASKASRPAGSPARTSASSSAARSAGSTSRARRSICGAPARLRFSGHGSGHGVGLCVIGSARLGAEGRSAAQILAKYSRACGSRRCRRWRWRRWSRESPPRASRASPRRPARRARRDRVAAGGRRRRARRDPRPRARRARQPREGARRAVPPLITLRFHPTVESYQAATGQPGTRPRRR